MALGPSLPPERTSRFSTRVTATINTGDAGLFVSRTAEPAFRIALHFHQGVVEAIAVTPLGQP